MWGFQVIQLAGYDVHYQQANDETRAAAFGRPETERRDGQPSQWPAMEIMDYR